MAWDAAHAEPVTITMSLDQLSLRLDTGSNSGNVDFGEKTTSSEGAYYVARKELTVDTNAPFFSLYLSMSTEEQKLCNKQISECAEGSAIVPIAHYNTSTQKNDVIDSWLTNGASTFGSLKPIGGGYISGVWHDPEPAVGPQWGYAITEQYTGDPSVGAEKRFLVPGSAERTTIFSRPCMYYLGENVEVGAFGINSYSACGSNNNEYLVSSATWLAVPRAVDQAHPIWTADYTKKLYGYKDPESTSDTTIDVCTPAEAVSDSSDCNSMGAKKLNVYYAIMADSSLVYGNYSNSVTYTAVASLYDDSLGGIKNAYLTSTLGGNKDNLEIILNMTALSQFTTDDVNIYMVDHNEFTKVFEFAGLGGEEGTGNAIKAWKFKNGMDEKDLAKIGVKCYNNSDICNVTGVSFPSASDTAGARTATGGSIKLTTPTTGTPLGTRGTLSDGTVLEDGKKVIESNGNASATYDFVIIFPAYNQIFSTRNGETGGVSYRYVGLQSKDAAGEYYVTKMQQMTTGICNMTTGYDVESGWYTDAGDYGFIWNTERAGGASPKAIDTFGPDDAFFATTNADGLTQHKTIARNYDIAIGDGTYIYDKDLGGILGNPTVNLADTTEYRDQNGQPVANEHTPSNGNPHGYFYSGTNYTNAEYYFWHTLTNGQRWEWSLYHNHQWILTDIRDGRSYVIRKLANGQCWMSQNLDFELQDNWTFSPADTDLQNLASFTPVSKWNGNADPKYKAQEATRGTYIVTQKQSLSEYGDSTWGWDDKSTEVFDYTSGDGVPFRYKNTRTMGSGTAANHEKTDPKINAGSTWVIYENPASSADGQPCETEITSGEILTSGTLIKNQISCAPHAYNAGNYYSFRAASAGTTEPASSSICPKGWMLPQSAKDTSYSRLLDAYGIDNSATTKSNYDAGLVNLPLSFLRSGGYYYNGTLYAQGSNGYYRMTSQRLNFYSGSLSPTDYTNADSGYSVRCVAR